MQQFLQSTSARVVGALAWLAVAGVVSYLVANQVAERNVDSALRELPAPQVTVRDRATVSLSEQLIIPVLSSSGRVVEAEDSSSFDIEAPVSPQSLAYQFMDPPIGIKAQIDGGPSGFDCEWVGLSTGDGGDVTMRCRVPDDIKVVAGLPVMMVLRLAEPVETLALPLSAVVGSAGTGQVVVITTEGERQVRQVTLGTSDGFWIEITDGLELDEVVLEVPVKSDFAQNSP